MIQWFEHHSYAAQQQELQHSLRNALKKCRLLLLMVLLQAHSLEERLKDLKRQQQGDGGDVQQHGGAMSDTKASSRKPGAPAPWPAGNRKNPYEDVELPPCQVNGFTPQKSFKVGKQFMPCMVR